MRNDNDDLDYAREEGAYRFGQKLQRMLINNDPFYPQSYHEQDVRGRLGLEEEDEE